MNNIDFVTNLAAALNPTETMNEIAEIDMLQKQKQTKFSIFDNWFVQMCNGNDTVKNLTKIQSDDKNL